MPRTVQEAKITTREQRKKLANVGPHWREIDRHLHLGYRKGKRGGAWLVREYRGTGKGYRWETFGTADDELVEGTLDYNAAVRRAKDVVQKWRLSDRAAVEGPALTVGDVIQGYMRERDARDSRRKGREVKSDATHRLGRYVVGRPAQGTREAIVGADLASVLLHELTQLDLQQWRGGLPKALKGNSKQRLINDLKAALNGAIVANSHRLPPTTDQAVRQGLRAEAAEDSDVDGAVRDDQILSNEQVGLLLDATQGVDAEQGWEGDLFRLIHALAGTGARFSQLTRCRVADVQLDKGRLVIPVSRKGRAGKSGSTNVAVAEDLLDTLRPALVGRPKSAPLLERWRKKQVAGAIRWERDERGPWRSSSEINRAWHLIRTRAGLPHVVPYALRYSSIVRGIEVMPIRLVAALHDTSVAMIERHYGRYIADGLDELAARSAVRLIPQRSLAGSSEQAA